MQGQLPSWVGPVVVGTDLLLVLLVTLGVARAARRAGFERRRRRRLVGVTVVTLVVWLGLAALVARAELSPLHPVALGSIFGPVAVGIALVLASPTWRRLLDAVPQTWLVGAQFYRVVGAVFLAGWTAGVLPVFFALPAGVGDIVTGVAAVVLAVLLARGVVGSRSVLVWNGVGLLDLVVAVGAGSTLLAGPLTATFGASAATTAPVVSLPLGLVPFFLVPISTLLHVYSLRRLSRGVEEPTPVTSTVG